MAGLGEFGAKIALKWACSNFIIRQFAVEHGKAIVMFAVKTTYFMPASRMTAVQARALKLLGLNWW